MSIHQQRIGKDPARGTIGLDLSVIQQQDAVAVVQHQIQIVRGDHLRRGKSREDADELPASPRVEIAGWFVEDQDFRITRQDSREADTFSFSVTELSGILRTQVSQADVDQTCADASPRRLPVAAELSGTKGDIVFHTGTKELVVGVLEHKSDLPPDAPQMILHDGLTMNPHPAAINLAGGRRRQQPVQMHQER